MTLLSPTTWRKPAPRGPDECRPRRRRGSAASRAPPCPPPSRRSPCGEHRHGLARGRAATRSRYSRCPSALRRRGRRSHERCSCRRGNVRCVDRHRPAHRARRDELGDPRRLRVVPVHERLRYTEAGSVGGVEGLHHLARGVACTASRRARACPPRASASSTRGACRSAARCRRRRRRRRRAAPRTSHAPGRSPSRVRTASAFAASRLATATTSTRLVSAAPRRISSLTLAVESKPRFIPMTP